LRVKIDKVFGPGVKISRGNYSKVKGCTIENCKMGIHVVSAQPSILFNKVRQNLENGVFCEAKKEIRCDALLQFNTIEKNNLNGVLLTGVNNFSKLD